MEVCSGPLWDLELTWNSDQPDFTPCFHKENALYSILLFFQSHRFRLVYHRFILLYIYCISFFLPFITDVFLFSFVFSAFPTLFFHQLIFPSCFKLSISLFILCICLSESIFLTLQ